MTLICTILRMWSDDPLYTMQFILYLYTYWFRSILDMRTCFTFTEHGYARLRHELTFWFLSLVFGRLKSGEVLSSPRKILSYSRNTFRPSCTPYNLIYWAEYVIASFITFIYLITYALAFGSLFLLDLVNILKNIILNSICDSALSYTRVDIGQLIFDLCI